MKRRSSKRAMACDISPDTRYKVWKRDDGCCVWCGRRGGYVFPEAHFIPRSKGGLGIPENILTLCRPCHDMFDNGDRRQKALMRDYFREYFKRFYPEWEEKNLYYHKEGL